MGRDNPILSLLSKAADLMLLNVMIIIGCIPIVTIGAAVTAGHFAALRIRRDEGKVFGDFCRSFKENFKQATAIWTGFLLIIVAVLAVLWFYGKKSISASVACVVVMLILYMLSLWVFPLLSRFVNTTGNTVKNAILLCVKHFFRTLIMLMAELLPVVALFVSLFNLPAIFLFGFSLPMYVNVLLYDKIFIALEREVMEHMGNNQ